LIEANIKTKIITYTKTESLNDKITNKELSSKRNDIPVMEKTANLNIPFSKMIEISAEADTETDTETVNDTEIDNDTETENR
jgi:hypothetical protein